MHMLTLASKHRKAEANKLEGKYIDFVVSDKSLSDLFVVTDLDLVGALGWSENKAYESEQLDQFLGLKASELKTGRISFYVCPMCADIGCGAITARIEITDTSVIWKDFGYETDYSEPELEAYNHIGPFVFEKIVYDKVMEGIRP
ncbi:hypothetical protein [Cytophaga aurantiaca]|uniref:hypothetical protein n=1 Tax=Cytophaga aurantiaca TaxID=29530 RepID=UPI00039F4512|nr:hypothetical protein [Cytophaga aurantiaca]